MQERARIIAENSYLIPDDKMRAISDEKKYILVGLNIEDLNANGIIDSLEGGNANLTASKLNDRLTNLEKIVSEKFDQILTELKKWKAMSSFWWFDHLLLKVLLFIIPYFLYLT